jgi:hypothetical protein
MLEAMNRWRPDGKVNLLWMAPACTYEFVHRRLDVFEKHVSKFRMLSLSDQTERDDALLRLQVLPRNVRAWYDASMLYFVSNNLEGPRDVPLLGMERFWRLANSQSVSNPRDLSSQERSMIVEVGEKLRLRESAIWSNGPSTPESTSQPGIPGFECQSAGHIGFWSDPATRRSLKSFVAGN